MTITLTLEGGHAGIVHALLEHHYVEMNSVADRFGEDADLTNPANRHILDSFRKEADECRMIGQVIEGLDPTLDPGDWRWPRGFVAVPPVDLPEPPITADKPTRVQRLLDRLR